MLTSLLKSFDTKERRGARVFMYSRTYAYSSMYDAEDFSSFNTYFLRYVRIPLRVVDG